jgi:U5 small nuclear ribonucleoprotein component
MVNTEQVIKHCVREGLAMTLVINKVDRLILELKLPPADAYFKLRHTVEEVNTIIRSIPGGDAIRLSPDLGNVCFASSQTGWIFSLDSFAKLYADAYDDADFEIAAFAKRLWGDVYYNAEKGSFHRKSNHGASKRTFVHFILEPLYKIYAQVIGEDTETLKRTLRSLGIYLKAKDFDLNVKPLLNLVLTQFFGLAGSFVEMVAKHVPSPLENAAHKVERFYTGPMTSKTVEAMVRCDADGPLMLQVTKLFNNEQSTGFQAFGRVFSGSIKAGQIVRVLGEGYSIEDEEDMTMQKVENTWIYESR